MGVLSHTSRNRLISRYAWPSWIAGSMVVIVVMIVMVVHDALCFLAKETFDPNCLAPDFGLRIGVGGSFPSSLFHGKMA
jgi:hypothetical protein